MSQNLTIATTKEDQLTQPMEILSFFDGKLLEVAQTITPEIWAMSEAELNTYFRRSEIDFMIRKNIHLAVKEARIKGETRVVPGRLYEGICTRQNFYTRLLGNKHRIAWYFLPVQDYQALIEDGLYYAIKKVRDELLTMPVTEKSAGHILKALEFFANRYLGPMLQRIESKNLNTNIDLNKPIEPITREDVLKRIKELESHLDKSKEPVDVTPE